MKSLVQLFNRLTPILVLLPPLVLFYWIISYGVDFPFYDEWIFMGGVLKEQILGDFTFSDFFTPHNDHRIATTYLVFLLFEKLGAWNRWNFYFLNFVTALATYFLMVRGFVQTRQKSTAPSILIIIALLNFSAAQLENWTWGFQIQWFHCAFFSLLTLYILVFFNHSRSWFSAALLSGVITSLTVAGGLFIWITGFCVCLFQTRKKDRLWIDSIVWAIVGVTTWYFYQHGIPQKHLLSSFLVEPWQAVKTFLTLLGAPLANFNWLVAAVFGAAGVVCFIIYTFNCLTVGISRFPTTKTEKGFLLWYSWSVFCCLSAMAIALARFSMGGPSYVLEASRYTTLIIPFWMGLILAWPHVFNRSHAVVRGFILLCFAFGFFKTTEHALNNWKYRNSILTHARNVLLSYDPTLLSQFAEPQEAIKRIGFINEETAQLLKQHKLSPYEQDSVNREALMNATTSEPAAGFIDSIHEIEAPNGTKVIQMNGWALNPIIKNSSNDSVVILSQGEFLAEIPTYLVRPDVNEVRGLTDTATVGWQFFTEKKNISPQSINAYLVSHDRTKVWLLNKNPSLVSPEIK